MGKQRQDQDRRRGGEDMRQGEKPMHERPTPQQEQEDKAKRQPGEGGLQRQWQDPEEREQQGGQR